LGTAGAVAVSPWSGYGVTIIHYLKYLTISSTRVATTNALRKLYRPKMDGWCSNASFAPCLGVVVNLAQEVGCTGTQPESWTCELNITLEKIVMLVLVNNCHMSLSVEAGFNRYNQIYFDTHMMNKRRASGIISV
jgi:hypothetical protein